MLSFNFSEKSTKLRLDLYEANIYPLIKQKAIGRSEFFGSFGGLMGLVAGMSLLSIIEMVLHLLVTVIQALKQYRKRNKIWAVNASKVVLKQSPIQENSFIKKVSTFFKHFVANSTIHGLQDIANKKKNMFEKLFWILTVLASTALCLVTIFDVTNHSELNPIEYGSDEKIWTLNDVRINFKVFVTF